MAAIVTPLSADHEHTTSYPKKERKKKKKKGIASCPACGSCAKTGEVVGAEVAVVGPFPGVNRGGCGIASGLITPSFLGLAEVLGTPSFVRQISSRRRKSACNLSSIMYSEDLCGVGDFT